MAKENAGLSETVFVNEFASELAKLHALDFANI